nr:6-phosphogluconate dehydrogenase, decarboxylating 2, chloroplastic [Tanacetum cinerariifolium]
MGRNLLLNMADHGFAVAGYDKSQKQIDLLGQEGARFGPSMMPGGDAEAYKVMEPVFDAIAAKVGDEPCVAYMGPGAAGHFVKMVHNGIEYGLMELIAETYGVLKTGLGMDDAAIGE